MGFRFGCCTALLLSAGVHAQGGVTLSGRAGLPVEAESVRNKVVFFLLTGPTELPDKFAVSNDGKGGFRVANVPPGRYILKASSRSLAPNEGDWFGELTVQVADSDVANLVVPLRPVKAVDVAGTMVLEGGGKAPPVFIGLQCRTRQGFVFMSDDNGSFVLNGLLPGHYMIFVGWPPDRPGPGAGGHATSIEWGGRDVQRTGFIIDGNPAPPMRITFRPL